MKNLMAAVITVFVVGVNAAAEQSPETLPGAVILATIASESAPKSTAAAVSPAEACECRRCLAVYGDSRSNHEIHAKMEELIIARRPQAVFHTGDMVESGRSKNDWEKFKEITKGLRQSASFYAVLGNHEEGGEKTFVDLFLYPGNGRWYRADLHGVRFLILDYISPLQKGSEQFKWLEAQLNSPMGANRFTAIVVHKPLISSGKHWDEGWKAAKDLERLLLKHKVALYLAGHDHNYERLEKDGIVYIVAGGGGAVLRSLGSKSKYSKLFSEINNYVLLSVCGGTLKGEAFDINDKSLDSFEIPAALAAESEIKTSSGIDK